MGMAIMWRICTVSEIQYLLHVKPLGEMIAGRFDVHGFGYEMKRACVLHIVQILLDWIRDEKNSICVALVDKWVGSYSVRGGICEDFGA